MDFALKNLTFILMKNRIIFTLFLAFNFNFLIAQLDLKEIMKGNEFVGYLPENQRWSFDGSKIYFDANEDMEPSYSTFHYDLASKEKKKLDLKSAAEAGVLIFDISQQQFNDQFFISGNSIGKLTKKTGAYSLVYQTNEAIFNLQRISGNKSPRIGQLQDVVFQKGINLYRYSENNGFSSIVQITNFQSGKAKDAKKDSTFLMKQQNELFQFVRNRNKRNEWNKKHESSLFPEPKTNYLGEGNTQPLQISENGKYVVVIQSHNEEVNSTSFEQFVTSDGYTKSIPARAKVSSNEPNQTMAIYQFERDSVICLDFSHLTDIRKKPLYMDNSGKGVYEKARDLFLHPVVFSKSKNVALCDVRSADNKDRWIVLIDLEKATVKELEHQHDEAWIGGPGISSWNSEPGTLGWLEDGKTFYFQSEISGYSHLYLIDIETTSKEQLTQGNFEVHSAQLSNDKKKFFISANKIHPGNRGFYQFEIATKKWIPVLENEGFYDVQVSPDEKKLAIRYSNSNTPWEMYVSDNVPNAKMTRITYSTTKQFNGYSWKKPEVIQIKASDGVGVYARLYQPEKSKKNNAAVMFVHGAGYLQNAHHYWSNYFREYMFHNLLVDLGYTVLDVDYRASEGYGRDYRTAIYRHMGGRDLQDFVDAKKYLVESLNIDSKRVGIYGGSYGGFITLMGLLTIPDEFACGAALRSVTDWAHYNHEYTSNILNYPETDPDAYRKSSPIYYAENLKNPLVMLHGMVDDNVQFQDVVRLSQRFIELGKKDWDLAVYPVEAHGFKESYSWYDEYRRIFELFEENLKK
jgi:dipeptidyl aminopeptidase/acylaminoacyl peptidase